MQLCFVYVLSRPQPPHTSPLCTLVIYDTMQGGGDSDTVSVLSQHPSMKPELEVTGPLDSVQTVAAAPDSEAARVRKVGWPFCSAPK